MDLSCHFTDEHTEAQRGVLLAWALVVSEEQSWSSKPRALLTVAAARAVTEMRGWAVGKSSPAGWLQCEQVEGGGRRTLVISTCARAAQAAESSIAWPPAPCSPQLARFGSRGCWIQASMHGFYGISAERWRGTYPGAFLTGIIFFLSFSQAISKSKLRSVSSFHNFS